MRALLLFALPLAASLLIACGGEEGSVPTEATFDSVSETDATTRGSGELSTSPEVSATPVVTSKPVEGSSVSPGGSTGDETRSEPSTEPSSSRDFLRDEEFEPMPGELVVGPLSFEEDRLGPGGSSADNARGWVRNTPASGPLLRLQAHRPSEADSAASAGRHLANVGMVRAAEGTEAYFNIWRHAESGIELVAGEVYEMRALIGTPISNGDPEFEPAELAFGLIDENFRRGTFWSDFEERAVGRVDAGVSEALHFQKRTLRWEVPLAMEGLTVHPAIYVRGQGATLAYFDHLRVSRVEEPGTRPEVEVFNASVDTPWVAPNATSTSRPDGWFTFSLEGENQFVVTRHHDVQRLETGALEHCLEVGGRSPGGEGRVRFVAPGRGELQPGGRYRVDVGLGPLDGALSLGTLELQFSNDVSGAVEPVLVVESTEDMVTGFEPLRVYSAEFDVEGDGDPFPFSLAGELAYSVQGPSQLGRWSVCFLQISAVD